MKKILRRGFIGVVAVATCVLPLISTAKTKIALAAGAVTPAMFGRTSVLANNPFYGFVNATSYFRIRMASDKLEARMNLADEYASRLARSYQIKSTDGKLMRVALTDYRGALEHYGQMLTTRLKDFDNAQAVREQFVFGARHLRLLDEVFSWPVFSSEEKQLIEKDAAIITSGMSMLLLGLSADDAVSIISAYTDSLSGLRPEERLRGSEVLSYLTSIEAAAVERINLLKTLLDLPADERTQLFSLTAGRVETRAASESAMNALISAF